MQKHQMDPFFFLSSVAVSAAGIMFQSQRLDWKTPTRYPDPAIVFGPRFDKYKLGNTPAEALYQSKRLQEGCAWNAVGRYLVFSDVPGDLQLRWIEDDNRVTVFRSPW